MWKYNCNLCINLCNIPNVELFLLSKLHRIVLNFSVWSRQTNCSQFLQGSERMTLKNAHMIFHSFIWFELRSRRYITMKQKNFLWNLIFFSSNIKIISCSYKLWSGLRYQGMFHHRGYSKRMSLKISRFLTLFPMSPLAIICLEPPPTCHTQKSDKLCAENELIFNATFGSHIC